MRINETKGSVAAWARAMKGLGKVDFEVTAGMEGALNAAFAKTQANVHVITGKLKASGMTNTDFDGRSWSGTISYGGPKGSPAYYGIYEQRRHGNRPDWAAHPPHDMFAGLGAEFDPLFENAIDEHFKEL